jgi:serine/threonine protein kinase
MEFVKGASITDFCDANRLSTKELLIQVCQTVQHARQKGITHRDIKPSNVTVTHHDGKPVPKIIDFGVTGAHIISQGLWIYDLNKEAAVQVLGGACGLSSWSEPELGQIAIQRSSYGAFYYEIRTAATDVLLPGKSTAKHAQEAIKFYTDFIEDNHENFSAYVSRAAFHIYVNDAKSAFADLERYESLVKDTNKTVKAFFWLGWYLCHVPQSRVDPAIAVKLLDRAYVLNPDKKNEWCVGALGIAHYRAGQWQDAIDKISRAIEMSRDGEINYYAFIIAMAYWQAGDKKQARTWYEKTVAWMSSRIAEGTAPSQETWQPAWCFYMESGRHDAKLLFAENEYGYKTDFSIFLLRISIRAGQWTSLGAVACCLLRRAVS